MKHEQPTSGHHPNAYPAQQPSTADSFSARVGSHEPSQIHAGNLTDLSCAGNLICYEFMDAMPHHVQKAAFHRNSSRSSLFLPLTSKVLY